MNPWLLLAPALLAAAPQTAIDGLPVGVIPRQQLPAKGCAAYLWTASGTRVLVAMAQADPARLRLAIDGKVTDLERSASLGTGGFGFAESNEYGAGALVVKLTMRIETKDTLSGGAVVPDALLQIDRTGQDSVMLPVAGIIGCA